jgi:hypothetical protein
MEKMVGIYAISLNILLTFDKYHNNYIDQLNAKMVRKSTTKSSYTYGYSSKAYD